MARTQKFSEGLLLEAVVKYAELGTGKIKATELASWARANIKGLEDVRDYHFMRPVKERNPQTGEITESRKPCTVRLEEINQARSLTESANRNILLRAAAIDTFLNQPEFVQRRQIAEAREMVNKLIAKNDSLVRTNESVRAENKSLREKVQALSEQTEALCNKQSKLMKQVNYLMKTTDEAARKVALAEMGLRDESVDLNVYTQSLCQEADKVMKLSRILGRHLWQEANDPVSREEIGYEETGLADKILAGIDFSGE